MSSRPDIVLINGVPARSVSVLDRGLHYGDGLFETITCRGGKPRLLELHLERLSEGCRRLGMVPGEMGIIRREIEQLASEGDASIVKLILTRGEAVARGYDWTGAEPPTRITLRYASKPEPSGQNRAWRVRTARLRLGENPALAGMKHLNRLEQVLARAELREGIEDELLLFSQSGYLVSGTMCNVFIVSDQKLLTPLLDRCGVAGVMRRLVMREAVRAGISVSEREVRPDELAAAEEVFLTNARIGVQGVSFLDGRELGDAPLTRRVRSLIEPLLEPRTHG